MNIWIANDFLTCIPGTKTFWHMLLEIPGTIDKTGTHNRHLAEKIEADSEIPNVIIRNASFCRKFNRSEKTIVFFQDLPRDDRKDEVVYDSDCVVFNSSYTARAYKKNWDKLKRAEIIPIGINTGIFKPTDSFVSRRHVGIFVGDKGVTKNTDLFEKIVKHRTDIDFIYVSKKGHKIDLPNVTNVGGGVNEEVMAGLYNRSDFILVTSSIETLHLSSVEAAFCGTSVIGTKTGWLDSKHWSEKCGIITLPEVDLFSKAIDTIVNSKRTFDYASEHMATTPFDWENCKSSWTRLIQEVIK